MGNVNKVELRRLAQAATAGDWEYRLGMVRTLPDSDGFVPVAVAPNAPKNWRKQRDANMEYIAAAKPSAVLALLDREAQAICEARHAEFQRDEAYAECARLREELEKVRKDASRWLCVRNAVPLQSPYAVWREGSHVVRGKDADDLVDNFLSHAKGDEANG